MYIPTSINLSPMLAGSILIEKFRLAVKFLRNRKFVSIDINFCYEYNDCMNLRATRYIERYRMYVHIHIRIHEKWRST